MRKLILFNMMSLDGFFAGPNGDISWHNVDKEFDDFAIEQLDSAGGLLFGRLTYQLMAEFWPSSSALADDPEVAHRMNSLPKYVFSRTLASADWNNTRLVKDNVLAEISSLKEEPGRDLFLFGSANLAASLIPNHLIDEYRVMLNPVVLGNGAPLFQGNPRLDLKLMESRPFQSGNVLLYYQ